MGSRSLSSRWLPWCLLAALTLLALPAGAQGNCLQQVGAPTENGNNVCIQVRNTCKAIVAARWEVQTRDYGIHGPGPVAQTQTGTVAIEPGQTATICARKPAASGTYCFRFQVQNIDQRQPNDRVVDWLNRIRVALAPGGRTSGVFAIGGDGELHSDVTLAADPATIPPGWSITLSRSEVAAWEFPAPVGWDIEAPPDAAEGESAVIRVDASAVDSGEVVGSADFEAVVTGALPKSGTPPPPSPIVEPPPPGELPAAPVLTWAGEEVGKWVAGKTMLIAWDQNGEFSVDRPASFEYFGPGVSGFIGDQEDRPIDSNLGTTVVAWDTTPLPPGDYKVRVTMIGDDGKPASTERIIRVQKKPQVNATAEFKGSTVTFSGMPSFDPDGSVVSWMWDFGDGTQASGPIVTHTFADPNAVTNVSLRVVDNDGWESWQGFTCAVANGELQQAATCGCASMDVKDAGAAGMDMDWMPPGQRRNLGGVNTIPNPVPGGAGGPYYALFNFEVVADLTPGSNPALCTSGQWVKRTSTADGATRHKRHDGVDYPYAGGVLGDDNQTGPSNVQQNEPAAGGNPPRIRWVDGPGVGDPARGRGLSAANVRAGAVTWAAKFFAIVTGPAGTCTCTWEVDFSIAATGAVTQAPRMTNKSCS